MNNSFKRIIEKANFCASCVTKPCQVGCPLNNDITAFIQAIKKQEYHQAFEILTDTTLLPAICGRVCPHEKQCQGACVKRIFYDSVSIGELEAFIGDMALKENWKIPKYTNHKKVEKVAIVGGGPAGLTCAGFLARHGISVTIFEKHEYLGGILRHGIPEFRLDKKLLDQAIQAILDLGVHVKLGKELGKDYTLLDLEKEYDAIFLGIGANISTQMGIPGEELDGVYGGNELLENNLHPDYHGKTVVVDGGGNVAMDVSRTIKRLGASRVIVIYRRSKDEMPAEEKEIKEAMDEGIEFLFQTNIVKVLGASHVEKIECTKNELVKKADDERLSPVEIPNSEFLMDVSYVVMAIGSKAEDCVVEGLGLDLSPRGKVLISREGKTSNPKVFAGGDVAGVKGTVAWASRSGRNASYAILEYLEQK